MGYTNFSAPPVLGNTIANVGSFTTLSQNGSLISLSGNFTTSGAFASIFTMTGVTSITFPTSGTLATTANTVASITGTANQVIASAATGAVTLSLPQSIATASTPQFAGLGVGVAAAASGILSTGNSRFGGSTAPTSVLEVQDTNQVVANGAGSGMLFVGSTNNKAADLGGQLLLGGSSSTSSFSKAAFASVNGRAENSTNANFAGYLQFATNNAGGTMSEKMRITSGGSVGIGTTAPLGSLSNTPTAWTPVTGGAGLSPNGLLFSDNNAGYVALFRNTLNSASSSCLGLSVRNVSASSYILSAEANSSTKFIVSSLGNVAVGSAALATTATDGFFYIPTCAGTPTGVPTTVSGVPMIYDTSANKFWIYNGSWRGVVLT